MRGAGKVCREAAGTIFRVNQGPPAPDVSSRERGSIGGRGGEGRVSARGEGSSFARTRLAKNAGKRTRDSRDKTWFENIARHIYSAILVIALLLLKYRNNRMSHFIVMNTCIFSFGFYLNVCLYIK